MTIVNLFGLERSVYTRIVRLALEEKPIAYSLSEVEIFGPGGVPPEYMARHPFGRIPAIEHDNFRLYETSAITRYVDEGFPGVQLQPSEPHARARMNQIVGLLDAYADPEVFLADSRRPRSDLHECGAGQLAANDGFATCRTTHTRQLRKLVSGREQRLIGSA